MNVLLVLQPLIIYMRVLSVALEPRITNPVIAVFTSIRRIHSLFIPFHPLPSMLENKNSPLGGRALLFHSNVTVLVLITKYANITGKGLV
jgi:hypothetical protein